MDTIRAGGNDTITNEQIAIARMLEANGNTTQFTKSRSPFELRTLVEKYETGIRFALDSVTSVKSGITVAPILAAVAAAFYHEANKEKLAQFLDILIGGLAMDSKTDGGIIKLRDCCLQHRSEHQLFYGNQSLLNGARCYFSLDGGKVGFHPQTDQNFQSSLCTSFPLPARACHELLILGI
ncbi:MAG: hypothetical protein MZW92_31235 [Comamonadaceae bacterium]|nr:hypothetical protein [Comamonadaceae bacterium]